MIPNKFIEVLPPKVYFKFVNFRYCFLVPQYILARGEKAKAAYQRALQFGKTKDKRVKIHVIGRDRAGKTSLVRSLKGERFREDEVSTDGVEMSQPLKNADKQPWKNGALPEGTTVYHHRFAQVINRDLAPQEESIKGLAADYAGITGLCYIMPRSI